MTDARTSAASPAQPAGERSAGGATRVPRIHFRGLRKSFGSRHALAGIDLDITGAQMVGVVGPDGAGKTTLLRTMAGLLDIGAGEASVLGFDLRADVRDLKRRIGYVPQAFSLYKELNIAENLSFTARLHGIDDDDYRRRSKDLLERTLLAPFADRKAGQLSGGMKQKLAIANALLPSPDLLILDEPTAGIDVVARREIFEILGDLHRRVLIVISTSYLEEAALCDHLVYMRLGEIVAQGNPAALEAATGTEAWRAWTSDPEAVREAARAIPWADGARSCGRFVRLEVAGDRSPGDEEICRTMLGLAGGAVSLVERAPADLESTLLALARRAGEQ